MRALKVEFAPARRPVAALAIWGAACALVAIGLGAAAWQSWAHRQAVAARAASDAQEAARLRAQLRERADRAAALAAAPAYARDALAVARTAAFPMQPALRSLETVVVDGVLVTAIELNAARGGADVTLAFDDYKALLAYLELLNEGEPAPRWSLLRAEASGARRQAVIRATWP